MRAIFFTTQYKKDLKLALKRNLPEEKLNEVIKMLAMDVVLPESNLDHPLKGQYKGCREYSTSFSFHSISSLKLPRPVSGTGYSFLPALQEVFSLFI